MEKRTNLTGGDPAKLVQLMRNIGRNVDVDIQLGTVTAPPPAIAVALDGDGITVTASDLIVAHSLTEHVRQVSFEGGGTTSLTMQAGLTTGDRVIVACMDDKMQYVILDKAVTY